MKGALKKCHRKRGLNTLVFLHTKKVEAIKIAALLWENNECDKAFKSLDMAKILQTYMINTTTYPVKNL